MFSTQGYVVERRKAPEGYETTPDFFRNYPQPNLPSAGYNKRCINSESNVVWALGWGDHGRLGTGTRENVIHTPMRVMDLLNDDYDEKQSRKKNKTTADLQHKDKTHQRSEVLDIALGGRHTLILMKSGEVLACGHGRNGQLGVGEAIRQEQLKPHIVNFPRPLEPIDIVAAGGLSSYAVSRRGLVFAWGCGKQGRLGLGDKYLTKDCPHPTIIPELSSIQTTGVIHIAAGTHHVHAMTASGALYSWGCNNAGQLGLGDTNNRSRPILVREFSFRNCTVLGVATSHQFSMAIVEGPIPTAPQANDSDEEDDDLVDVEEVEKLRIDGNHVRRRAMTAPSSYAGYSQQTKGNRYQTGGVELKPNDPRNQNNWSRINVRLAPTATYLKGEELDAVVHTSFRPKHFDKEFLQYEPEMLSRPHSRVGTPSNNSVLSQLQHELSNAVSQYRFRASTAPANIQTRNNGQPVSLNLSLSQQQQHQFGLLNDRNNHIPINEAEVLKIIFRLSDKTAEGPHFLENKSVRENQSINDRRKGPKMISCLAVRKKKLLYALGKRDGEGPLNKEIITLIENEPMLKRLHLLLVPNFIASRLREMETEIAGRVTIDELLDLLLAQMLVAFRLQMTQLFDLTLNSVSTQIHGGMVLRSNLHQVMTTRNDAKRILKPTPSLVSLIRRQNYAKGSVWYKSNSDRNIEHQSSTVALEDDNNNTGDEIDVGEDEDEDQEEDDEDEEEDEEDAQEVNEKGNGEAGVAVKKKKVAVKKKRRKKKKGKPLTTKEKAAKKAEKIRIRKEKKRQAIGNHAFEEYDRQDHERIKMFAEDSRSISIDEFVHFALVTAGRSPEGYSLDGSGIGEPKRRQVVFVWGFGDARLGLGKEACDWYELPNRDPKLRHQLVPTLCRPLSDDVDFPVETISLGETHGLALTRDRRVYTWGRNEYMQLGLRDNKTRPNPEEMNFLEGCVDVQAARYWSMALRHTGEVYTWGQGRDGVLGHGEAMSRGAPHLVLSMQGRKVQQIFAGPSHAMMITSRAPTFGITRPEHRIKVNSRVRGVERWNLSTNVASRLRNRNNLIQRAGRFTSPIVKFEFPLPIFETKKENNNEENKEEKEKDKAKDKEIDQDETDKKDNNAEKETKEHIETTDNNKKETVSLPKLKSPRRLPPLTPLLDQVALFGEKGVRHIYPLDVLNAHDLPKQRRPLFNDLELWQLTDGRDGERDISTLSDKDRAIVEIQWRKHRDESFREKKKRKKSTIKIQALSRRFKVRLWIYEVWRRKSAATLIQRRQRGIRGRKVAQRKREVRAAILMQKRIRGRIYRQKNKGRIEKAKNQGRQKVTEKYAAVMVQKRIRGKMSRKISQKMMKSKRKADKKAAKKRKAEAKRAKEAKRILDLRIKSIAKAREMYDPTNEMDDDELIEVALAMGGEWDF